MSTLCLHHNDADGRACGAIVRRALGPKAHLYEIDYGERVPWENIQAASQVIVADFSLPAADMQRIAALTQLVWIDHHISAIKEMEMIEQDWPGLRDINEAACVLTWRYFYADRPEPRAIVLIGDRDVWRMAEADTRNFNEGLFNENNQAGNDDLWQPLLDDDQAAVRRLTERGGILLAARLRSMRRFVRRNGIEVKFEGHPTLAVNRVGDGDLGEYIRDLGFEIAYCYIDGPLDGKIRTFVTLFSRQADVSVIARRYGGGGHHNAAGFSFERGASPFPPGAEVEF